MEVSLIVAVARNGVIGRGGDLPWRLPADLRRFKRITWGHHLVMGRKTFESIGRPLPGRTSIVLSRQADYAPRGALVARSIKEAVEMARGDSDVFVIGGGEIYRLALPLAARIHLTTVEADVEGDTFLPPFDPAAWQVVERSAFPADEDHAFAHTYEVLERLRAEDSLVSPC